MRIYEVVPLAYVARQIDPTKPLFFDVETKGLYGEIVLAQFMQEDWEEALLVERPELEKLLPILELNQVVAHNVSYELSCIGSILPRFEDTMMLAKLVYYYEEKLDLANVYTYALRYDPYKESGIDKKVMQKTNWGGALTDKHYTYAAIDVYYMPELWRELHRAVEDDNYKLDIITIRHCQVMEKTGLPLLPLKQELDNTLAKLQEIEEQLPVNPRSSQQVKSYLNSPQGTSADILAEIISRGGEMAERAMMVRDARQLSKYKSTYLEKMAGHSRWYGHFSPRTRSGRLASSENNLQNLPRQMKKFIGFLPIDNKVLVSADFAQLEMRTIACIAKDATMLSLFNNDEDLHGYMATVIFGPDYTPEQRQIAKVANFSLLYGAGAAKFASILLKLTGIIISESEAQKVKRKWLATFKGVAKWQQEGIKQWRAGNFHWTPMGRKYKAKMLNDYLNIENQGAGAEISKLAFHYIMSDMLKDSAMCDFVHDSYLVECPNDPAIYKKVAELLADSMQLAWKEYAKIDPNFALTKMPVTVGVALNWKDADEAKDNCLYVLKRKN